MVKVVIVCTMMHVCAIISFHGPFVAYLGASEVAPLITPGHPVAVHKAQGVCTCALCVSVEALYRCLYDSSNSQSDVLCNFEMNIHHLGATVGTLK